MYVTEKSDLEIEQDLTERRIEIGVVTCRNRGSTSCRSAVDEMVAVVPERHEPCTLARSEHRRFTVEISAPSETNPASSVDSAPSRSPRRLVLTSTGTARRTEARSGGRDRVGLDSADFGAAPEPRTKHGAQGAAPVCSCLRIRE